MSDSISIAPVGLWRGPALIPPGNAGPEQAVPAPMISGYDAIMPFWPSHYRIPRRIKRRPTNQTPLLHESQRHGEEEMAPIRTYSAEDWDEMSLRKGYDLMAANARAASSPQMMESKSCYKSPRPPSCLCFLHQRPRSTKGSSSIISSCVPGVNKSFE